MSQVTRTVGRYAIVREVGRGGMAIVYLARQLDLDRLVALKELGTFQASDPALAQRFVRESRLAGSIVHPNVVTVFDYFQHDGTPYIAMEYVERGSLRPYVGQMSLAQVGGVLEGVLAGLGAAEERSIVHRDLKPANLMVTNDGRVKIADFGIAKATLDTKTGGFVTATGASIGTPAYMAPEQALGGDIGPWTDLYSVGCMAYELFTGKPPFHDTDTPLALVMRHINEPLPPAAALGVDPALSAWIERLTLKDGRLRPQSAAAAWDELEEALLGLLGPRWRRESRLGVLPQPPAADLDSASPSIAPTTPMPAETPAAESTPPPPGPEVASSGPVTASRLARGGAVALLAALLIPLLADGAERWNFFAVLSPFEAAGVAGAVWLAARRPNAGALVGYGTLMTVAGLAALKFTAARASIATVLALIVLAGALAILVAGVRARRAEPREEAAPLDPALLILGLAGTGLATVALFVSYDGFSSLWVELQEVESAEFFFEPALAAAAMLAELVLLGALPRFASGLLLATGTAATLHYLGLLVAAALAIGEPGSVKSAGFLGLLGGLLLAAAAAYASRPARAG